MIAYQDSGIKNERFLYLALRFNVLLTVMNTTMFNVALPVISSQLRLSPSHASWVVTSYSVMFAIGTVLYSRLTDLYSIKRLLTVGLLLLGVGSVVGLFAHQLSTLIAARLIQALGASCIPGVSMIITNRYIPLERRGEVFGKVSSAATLAFGMGPMLGGLIAYYAGWEYLFFVTLFAVLMLPVYHAQLPFERGRDRLLDIWGLVLVSAGVVCWLLCFSLGWPFFVAGLAAFGAFWVHIHRGESPFISPILLKKERCTLVLAIGFFAFFVNFSVLFMVPLLLAVRFYATPIMIGLVVFPGAICSAFFSVYIGRLLDRVGTMKIFVMGLALLACALFSLSSFGYTFKGLVLLFCVLSSMGFACMQAGLPYYLARMLPAEEFNTAIGLQQLVQFFGGAFGVTCMGRLLSGTSSWGINPLWSGEAIAYSNAFFYLQGAVLISALLVWRLKNCRDDTKMNCLSNDIPQ